MYLRLVFSVAIHTDPKILLIDEVFVVGDEAFQKKCMEEIREFQKRDKTIVFVSHDLNMVRNLCQRLMLLNEGMVISTGYTEKVIGDYVAVLQGK
jgi:ABC-2 type transport system ATP-binding protein